MARKYYYSAFPLGEGAEEPMHTGRNSKTREGCVEDVFDFWSHEADEDDMESDKLFVDYTYKEKEAVVECLYEIEEHGEPYPDDEFDEDDGDTQAFLQEYGESYTTNDEGGRYIGCRGDY
jgi:hypothetical protein